MAWTSPSKFGCDRIFLWQVGLSNPCQLSEHNWKGLGGYSTLSTFWPGWCGIAVDASSVFLRGKLHNKLPPGKPRSDERNNCWKYLSKSSIALVDRRKCTCYLFALVSEISHIPATRCENLYSITDKLWVKQAKKKNFSYSDLTKACHHWLRKSLLVKFASYGLQSDS